jgi:hypothetical protein
MSLGGRRAGAGRAPGTGWKKEVRAFRHDAVEKAKAIVNSGDDPLTVVAGWVMDVDLDIQTRMSAASICLPFLYPKLSSSQVDARLTVTKIDTNDLIRKLDERLFRMAAPATIEAQVEEPVPVVEIVPDEAA